MTTPPDPPRDFTPSDHPQDVKPEVKAGAPTWYNVVGILWIVASFVAAFWFGKDDGKIAVLFLTIIFMLPLVVLARLAGQGKWSRTP